MESEEQLSKMKVPELKTLCKERKLAVSGTKTELIDRILGRTSSKTKTPPKKKQTKPEPLKKPVFQNYLSKVEIQPILIKRNIHGNFEHPETKFIFNISKKIIGLQLEDGTIGTLTVSDIEQVHKYHFELDDTCIVEEKTSTMILEDDSLKQQRIDELLELTKDE